MEQFQTAVVAPVEILNYHQEWLALGLAQQKLSKGHKETLSLVFRSGQRLVIVARGQAHQIRQKMVELMEKRSQILRDRGGKLAGRGSTYEVKQGGKWSRDVSWEAAALKDGERLGRGVRFHLGDQT
jgi:hypothetical protein